MARIYARKKPFGISETPEVTEAPEVTEVTEVTEAPYQDFEAPIRAVAPASASAPQKTGLIYAIPVKGDLWEPFQHLAIRMGVKTPVRLTSWIKSQVQAGLLIIERD